MSGPPNFNTIERCIHQAHWNAGLVADGQIPNSEQYANGFNRLNDLINFHQIKGLKLFQMVDTPITTLTAGLNFYPLGPAQTGISMTKPLRIPFAYFLDQVGNRVPMIELSWQEWTILPVNTTAPGQPVNFFVDKQPTFLGVYVWPAPNATAALGSVHLVLQTQVANGQSLTGQMVFPPEWFLGMTWTLADELAVGQPLEITARCDAKRREYMEALESWDVEDAQTFLSPDPRGAGGGNSFA